MEISWTLAWLGNFGGENLFQWGKLNGRDVCFPLGGRSEKSLVLKLLRNLKRGCILVLLLQKALIC